MSAKISRETLTFFSLIKWSAYIKWLCSERTKDENKTEINVRIADTWKHSRKFSRQEITESTEDPLTKKFSAESFPELIRGKRFFTLRLPEARPVSLKFHGRARSWKRLEPCILILRRNSTSDPTKNRRPMANAYCAKLSPQTMSAHF